MRLSELTTLLAVVGMTGVANARVIVEDFTGTHQLELSYDFGTGTDFSGPNPGDDNDFFPGVLWLYPDLVTVTVTSLEAWEYIESVEVTWTDWDGLGRTKLTAYDSLLGNASVVHSATGVPETVMLSTLDLGGENIDYFTLESWEAEIDRIVITIVPSPSSVVLLGFGGLIAVRRRR